ncbi:hypothetical protein LUX34_00955 [Streptomyces werraensis]|nr:hypothetical protein [Streptomyces werraensis]
MTADLAGTVEHPFTRREFAALYAQAQRYYAHQMRILDAPDTESWAATFTEDAVLELPSLPGPVPPTPSSPTTRAPAPHGSGGPAAASTTGSACSTYGPRRTDRCTPAAPPSRT